MPLKPEVWMPPLEVLHPLVHAPVRLVGKRGRRHVLVLLVPRRRVRRRIGGRRPAGWGFNNGIKIARAIFQVIASYLVNIWRQFFYRVGIWFWPSLCQQRTWLWKKICYYDPRQFHRFHRFPLSAPPPHGRMPRTPGKAQV